MFLNHSRTKTFEKGPSRSNICPECGEVQVLKWDKAGDARNIVLTFSSHEECCIKYWKNIKEFDYAVAVKADQLKEVA